MLSYQWWYSPPACQIHAPAGPVSPHGCPQEVGPTHVPGTSACHHMDWTCHHPGTLGLPPVWREVWWWQNKAVCKQILCMMQNNGWGNGLLPESIKPLPKSMLTYDQWLRHPEPQLNEIPNLWLYSQTIAGIFLNITHFCLQCLQIGEVHQHTILEIILFPQHWNTHGYFANVSPAVQNILSKLLYCRNHTSWENFKLKLCMCAQSDSLGTCTKFQLDNSHHKCHFWHCLFSQDYFGELVNNPQPPTPFLIASLTDLFEHQHCPLNLSQGRWRQSQPQNGLGFSHVQDLSLQDQRLQRAPLKTTTNYETNVPMA